MRTLVLSSLSLFSGFIGGHAQLWVPYSFYAFRQTPSQVVDDKQLSESTEEWSETQPNEKAYSREGLYAQADIACSGPHAKVKDVCSSHSHPSRLCSDRAWVEADYLLAWMKKEHIDVPLITTGSGADAFPGAIGQSGTHVAYGNQDINFHRFEGVRAAIGAYANDNKSFSWDIGSFWIFSKRKNFSLASDATGNPLIARPFFDLSSSSERAEEVSNLTSFSGTSSAQAKSQLWGGEINFGYHPCVHNLAGNLFVGFRYLRLLDRLQVRDFMTPYGEGASGLKFNGLSVNSPDTLEDKDVFKTSNNFYGGQLGARVEFENNWWSVNLFGKVGLGVTREKYQTLGSTTWYSASTGDQYAVGGVLVQPNNSVNYERSVFAWVPEAGINVGFEPFRHLHLLVGYSFLWWNKVIRPGEQIDRNVNAGEIPRDASFFAPLQQAQDNDLKNQSFWMQTVNFGIRFDF